MNIVGRHDTVQHIFADVTRDPGEYQGRHRRDDDDDIDAKILASLVPKWPPYI